ncbi:hypothetical protein [Halobacteriovorax sp. HLS]|uniref:hypothetical protein n=1 Tax=Halobacteriovorax sp. HLS TaxID=2234000 RepID=UPI000FD78A1A|nr:hypothetical protein [Halobacteriovorax sp. HLS]
MKTILSYITKCILVYTISFTLVQVQVLLPIQSLKHSAGYVQAETGVAEDGVATESGQTTLDSKGESAAMDLVLMMAFGIFTSRAVVMCKPVPTDVMIAAAGGIAYLGAEIMAFNGFKDIKKKNVINYKIREDGQNTEQIDYLKDQKKGYEDIAKTAKQKKMIQTVAAAAYGIAAATAWIKMALLNTEKSGCAACIGSTSVNIASQVALEGPPAPSKVKGTSLLTLCSAIAGTIITDTAAWTTACSASVGTAAPACAQVAVCTAAAASCTSLVATCAAETAVCIPSTAVALNPGEDASSHFVHNSLKFPDLAFGLTEEDIQDVYRDIQIEDLKRTYGVNSFIESTNPLYDLNKSLKITGSNVEEQINSYMQSRDSIRFYKGEKQTASIQEYQSLKESFFQSLNSANDNRYSNSLQLAIDYGIDLIIPSAQASSFTTILGGSVAIVLGAVFSLGQTVDTFLATPGTRGVAWLLGAGLAMAAASKTGSIQEEAEENAEKIQKIIDQMNRINKQSTDTLSGTNLSIPSKIPYPLKGNDGIIIDNKKLPCADTDKNVVCQKLSPQVENSQGFAQLGGTMGGLALSAAQAGDDLFGNSRISSSGVDNMVGLANQNNAIQKRVRAIKKKLNDQIVANGGKAINFDKMNDKLLAKLRKRTQDALNKSGKSANDVLASIGQGASTKEDSKEEKVAIKGPGEVKPTTGGAANSKKAPVFTMDLDEDNQNTGISADEVAANQLAANQLNAEASDDIVTNKGVSIFKVISVRYLKSGFSRLLEEKEKTKK